jgi:hypothetical protein
MLPSTPLKQRQKAALGEGGWRAGPSRRLVDVADAQAPDLVA